MVILGLGSNIGDRLANLRKALRAIKQLNDVSVLQVSPVYISDALLPENAPADWDMPYLNLAIRADVACTPEELLPQLKKIEWTIGRKPEKRHWGPREVDIDILAWDDRVIDTESLTVPHASLQERPFALWPLADVAPFWRFPLTGTNHDLTAGEIAEKWGSRFSGDAPFHTRQIYQRIDMPSIVGILNITPDSFSDGGLFSSVDDVLAQAKIEMQQGAEILDIGAESTAPNAKPITPGEEWQRLLPVLMTILENKKSFFIPPKISVDTRHAETAEKVLSLGIDWLNDVTGLEDPKMCEVIAASVADCVIMHHVSIPASRAHIVPRDVDIVPFLYEWAARRIDDVQKKGIDHSRIIFDPGIGFGKIPEQSLALIQHADQFKSLGVRILIGHSRKSFLTPFTPLPPKERDVETLAITLNLAKKPIDYLRVHDVFMTARGMKVASFLSN